MRITLTDWSFNWIICLGFVSIITAIVVENVDKNQCLIL